MESVTRAALLRRVVSVALVLLSTALLAAPAQAIHSSIAALAQESGVSEPTVNRFCRSMETRGFPDFKLHLAQSLANGTPYVNRNVDEDDSVEAYTGKIFESAMATLDLPLWSWGAARSRVKSAHLARRQAQVELSFAQRKLVADLKASFDYCSTALSKIDDSKLAQPVTLFGGRKGNKAAALIGLSNNWADHYIAAAMYLRLNGLLPPSAQKK